MHGVDVDRPVGPWMVWVKLWYTEYTGYLDAGVRCVDRPSMRYRIPDGLGNIGTRDTYIDAGVDVDRSVGFRMVWVTLVPGILRRRG